MSRVWDPTTQFSIVPPPGLVFDGVLMRLHAAGDGLGAAANVLVLGGEFPGITPAAMPADFAAARRAEAQSGGSHWEVIGGGFESIGSRLCYRLAARTDDERDLALEELDWYIPTAPGRYVGVCFTAPAWSFAAIEPQFWASAASMQVGVPTPADDRICDRRNGFSFRPPPGFSLDPVLFRLTGPAIAVEAVVATARPTRGSGPGLGRGLTAHRIEQLRHLTGWNPMGLGVENRERDEIAWLAYGLRAAGDDQVWLEYLVPGELPNYFVVRFTCPGSKFGSWEGALRESARSARYARLGESELTASE